MYASDSKTMPGMFCQRSCIRSKNQLRIRLQLGREEGTQKPQAVMVRRLMDSGMSLDQIATILKMAKKN